MDVLIINLPKMEPYYLPAAPAILKGACNYLKLTSKVIDFNLNYIEFCQLNNLNWRTITSGLAITDTIFSEEILEWAQTIVEYNPKVLAVSIFSYYGQLFANTLLMHLKDMNFAGTIVLGGSGISDSINGPPNFGNSLVEKNLATTIIINDAENSWIDFLITQFNLPTDISVRGINMPYFPDYSDYLIDTYLKYKSENGQLYVPVTGSRGCVRKCTFCEIHRHWKFEQRSATYILQEITKLVDIVDNPHIHFTDSLVNGNMKEFLILVNGLASLARSGVKFSWGGQFIIRNSSTMNESHWKLMGESNCKGLEIGIETGSDELRKEMKKNFTNSELDYALQMMKKYNVSCMFLLFVGYPTETIAQFNDTLSMFEKYVQYANNVISQVELNYSMGIFPRTPLYEELADELGIKTTWDPVQWFCTKNPELTMAERIKRRIILQNHIEQLGYTPSFNKETEYKEMLQNYQVYKNAIAIIDRN